MEFIKVIEPKIGKEYFIPSEDGKSIIPCMIISGQFYRNGRISNTWEWINLLTRETESGYGGFYELRISGNEDKRGIITASEARAKTESVRNDRVSREMKRIEQEICKGDNNIALDGTIKRETVEHLRSLGYEAHTGSQYNESYFTIKW